MTDDFATAFKRRFPERGPVLEALERMASAPSHAEQVMATLIDRTAPISPEVVCYSTPGFAEGWACKRFIDHTHPDD